MALTVLPFSLGILPALNSMPIGRDKSLTTARANSLTELMPGLAFSVGSSTLNTAILVTAEKILRYACNGSGATVRYGIRGGVSKL
eukprot:114393-Pleurochrysis_carterae.AAC.2